ncbi:MAG: hypothetical protein ACXQTV_03445, partial [Candidatus Hecatellaceae archaeon]
VGGGLVLAGLLWQALTKNPKIFYEVFLNPTALPNLLAGESLTVSLTFFLFSIAFAAAVIVGGVLLLYGRSLTGGSVTLVFTVLGILCGGGWALGFLLAFIGGIIGLVSKPKAG